jgi:hypothetical protein
MNAHSTSTTPNPSRIYVWDNGEELLDHSVWFIESDLDPTAVEAILDAAVSGRRRGGVVAVIDAGDVLWRQMRTETLATWFTCHGDELVDWRTRRVHAALRLLPKDVARSLSHRLYPSNAEIVAESLGLEI